MKMSLECFWDSGNFYGINVNWIPLCFLSLIRKTQEVQTPSTPSTRSWWEWLTCILWWRNLNFWLRHSISCDRHKSVVEIHYHIFWQTKWIKKHFPWLSGQGHTDMHECVMVIDVLRAQRKVKIPGFVFRCIWVWSAAEVPPVSESGNKSFKTLNLYASSGK